MHYCSVCKQTLTDDQFYSHPYGKDGLLNKCKPCHRAAMTALRNANIERYRQYDRERAKLPHRKASLFKNADPERVKVAKIANAAVRKGLLQRQPCHICGAEKVEAHHTHYSHPLEVVWLCRSHHVQLHRQFSIWSKKAA